MQAPDWNDLRLFLAIARAEQIARAARALGADPTTLGRRLRRLEAALGQRLFEQTREGQALTRAGEALLQRVEAMQAAADRIVEEDGARSELAGVLRLSVSEGFGTWFVARHLPDFAAQHPGLTVDLVASSGFLSPSKRETDIAILLARPRAGHVVCARLSHYGLGFYGAHDHLARVGVPAGIDGLGDHRLIGYVPDLLYAPELRYLEEVRRTLSPAIRSTSINAQHRLIQNGGGIGVLPCFIGDADPALRRILPEVAIRRTFWIVTHKDNQRLARVRAFKTWITQLVRAEQATLLGAAAKG